MQIRHDGVDIGLLRKLRIIQPNPVGARYFIQTICPTQGHKRQIEPARTPQNDGMQQHPDGRQRKSAKDVLQTVRQAQQQQCQRGQRIPRQQQRNPRYRRAHARKQLQLAQAEHGGHIAARHHGHADPVMPHVIVRRPRPIGHKNDWHNAGNHPPQRQPHATRPVQIKHGQFPCSFSYYEYMDMNGRQLMPLISCAATGPANNMHLPDNLVILMTRSV